MGPSGDPTTVVLVVEATIGAADARALADRMHALIEGQARRLVLCDVTVIVRPDIATVDALARLALGARRAGCRVGLRHASPELRNLLALAGLGQILPCAGDSAVEARGQAEEREERRGIQEERDAADPIA
jgi:anti-anti-sigma regulatory factor